MIDKVLHRLKGIQYAPVKPTYILISGVPASGKTTFGNWLHQNRGFLHLDMEDWDGTDIHYTWEKHYRTNMSGFLKAIVPPSKRVVFTWGFPIQCFPIVACLRDAGVTAWWFDADYAAARRDWLDRQQGRGENIVDMQLDALKKADWQIRSFYGKNILRTLGRKGRRLTPQQIAVRLRIPTFP